MHFSADKFEKYRVFFFLQIGGLLSLDQILHPSTWTHWKIKSLPNWVTWSTPHHARDRLFFTSILNKHSLRYWNVISVTIEKELRWQTSTIPFRFHSTNGNAVTNQTGKNHLTVKLHGKNYGEPCQDGKLSQRTRILFGWKSCRTVLQSGVRVGINCWARAVSLCAKLLRFFTSTDKSASSC